MKQTNPSLAHIPDADWQVLSELELEAGVDSESTIHAWLADILNPFNLPHDFQNKILQSAQMAAARLLREDARPVFDHIHLLILVLPDHGARRGTWGFFRIEKIDQPVEGGSNPDHAIELYMYLEG